MSSELKKCSRTAHHKNVSVPGHDQLIIGKVFFFKFDVYKRFFILVIFYVFNVLKILF